MELDYSLEGFPWKEEIRVISQREWGVNRVCFAWFSFVFFLAAGITHALGFKYVSMLKAPKCMHPDVCPELQIPLTSSLGYLFIFIFDCVQSSLLQVGFL